MFIPLSYYFPFSFLLAITKKAAWYATKIDKYCKLWVYTNFGLWYFLRNTPRYANLLICKRNMLSVEKDAFPIFLLSSRICCYGYFMFPLHRYFMIIISIPSANLDVHLHTTSWHGRLWKRKIEGISAWDEKVFQKARFFLSRESKFARRERKPRGEALSSDKRRIFVWNLVNIHFVVKTFYENLIFVLIKT